MLTDAEILSQFRDYMARKGDGPATFEPLKNHPNHRGVMDMGYVRPAPKDFPSMVYHPSGMTKIVQSAEEKEALGPSWSTTPPRKSGDWRAKLNEVFTKSGFRVYQHHLDFLRDNNVQVGTLQEAGAFIDALDEIQQEEFFREAEDFQQPETKSEKKKKAA